jgi:hypothetical protein
MAPERNTRGTRDLAKTAGEWIPVLVPWVAVLGLLLAIAGALLGEPG